MTRVMKNETEEMRHCYDVYLSLGSRRDVVTVAQLVGKSPRTIHQYKKSFDWEGRVHTHCLLNGPFPEPDNIGVAKNDGISPNPSTSIGAALVEFTTDSGNLPIGYKSDVKKTPEEIIREYSLGEDMGAMTKNEYRLLLGHMVRDFAKRFRQGDVKINTIYEFERIVKLDLLLMGEYTSKKSIDHGGLTINNNTNNAEYTLKIEQVLHNNPKAQELMGELWRSYNVPQDKRVNIGDTLNVGMENMKTLIGDPMPQTGTTGDILLGPIVTCEE